MKDFLNNLANIKLLLVYCYHSHKEGIRQSLFHIFVIVLSLVVMLPIVRLDDSYMSRAVVQDLYDTEEKTFCLNEILLYTFRLSQKSKHV